MVAAFNITSPDLVKQEALFEALQVFLPKKKRVTARQGGNLLLLGWQEVAARDTGFYANTLDMEIKEIAGTTPITQTAVFTNARSSKGFPYPRALEESTRYHYQSTTRKGQSTAGQVSLMFKNKEDDLEILLAILGNEIIEFLAIG
ncbi:MAG: hypothetical protein KAJ07_04780 [Planctomycetes bacterium]|nr:hypothetical protein [Planctomycetota bacterium]